MTALPIPDYRDPEAIVIDRQHSRPGKRVERLIVRTGLFDLEVCPVGRRPDTESPDCRWGWPGGCTQPRWWIDQTAEARGWRVEEVR